MTFASGNETRVVNYGRKFPDDPGAVYIGRGSPWGNPFIIGIHGDRKECIEKYRKWIVNQAPQMKALHLLRGKRLACFCFPKPCHGDVLVELISQLTTEEKPVK